MKKEWIINQLKDKSKTIPILSFPTIQLLNVTVKEFVNSSELQAKGIELIASKYPISASVGLMDLSVEAEAFGSTIRSFDMEVPTVIGRIIFDEESAKNLVVPKVGSKRTKIYLKAIEKTSKLVDKPILAGVIGPFSLAGRLMDMTEIMINCYENPTMVHTTLKKTSEFILNYILAFKANGAKGIIIAEPAAGLLSPDLCEEFSSSYIKDICAKVKDDNFIVVYHNCGNVIPLYKSISSIDADIYHFGNAIDIEQMLKLMPKDKLIMGNIDPAKCFKNGSVEYVKETTKNLLTRCNKYENFIISSGCDIPPATKWENIEAYFEAIKEFYIN